MSMGVASFHWFLFTGSLLLQNIEIMTQCCCDTKQKEGGGIGEQFKTVCRLKTSINFCFEAYLGPCNRSREGQKGLFFQLLCLPGMINL